MALSAIGCGAEPPELPSCRLLLAPDAEALEAVEAAAGRWGAATGCDLPIDAGGLPVRVVDQVYDADGNPIHAGTFMSHNADGSRWPEHIEFTRGAGVSLEDASLHEIGHALRVKAGHAESGLMGPFGASSIDAESLAFVCEFAECGAFVPEH